METGKVNCSKMDHILLMQRNCNGSGKPWATPCAACKLLRRRCAEKCLLAPYFPPDNPQKFSTVHRVFGACNIIKMLKDLPADRRNDAVTSMVYEANVRLLDPVYSCAGIISQLQHRISDLQSQLARAQAEIFNLRLQQSNLISCFSQFYISREDAMPITTTEIDPHNNDNNEEYMEELFLHDC